MYLSWTRYGLLAALMLCACSDDSTPQDAGADAGDLLSLDLPAGEDPVADALEPDQYTGDIVFFGDSQAAGWPAPMTPGVSGKYLLSPMDGVAFHDLDPARKGLEVIASSGDQVYALGADGTPLAGWPATVQGTAQAPPSVGDVDGDGLPEVVQVGRGLQYSDTSYLHVLDEKGQAQSGWPKAIPNLVFRAATLADLDGDGAMEIIVQIGKWPPAGNLAVYRGDGSDFGGTAWQHALDSYPMAPAAVGDLDGDGKLEVGYLTLGNVTVRQADGNLRSGFPIAAEVGHANEGSVVFADLDSTTSALELVWADVTDTASGPATVRLWAAGADGKPLAGFPVTLSSQASGVADLVVADVDGDGELEVVVPVKPSSIYVVSGAGAIVGQPVATAAQMHASVRAVDLTGDGKLELLADNNTTDKTGIGYLEAYHADGTPVADFPLRPFGSTMGDSGSLADLDGDGTLELAVVTTSTLVQPLMSWVSLWSRGKPTSLDWPIYAADVRRSNCPRCASASTP